MENADLGHLILMAVMLVFSAFFSGSETALFNLTTAQLSKMQRSGGKVGRLVAAMMARPSKVLNTLLLGNMLVNIAFAATSAVFVLALEAKGAQTATLLAASFTPLLLVILLGEVAPKVIALQLREKWALLAIPAIAVLEKILSPVVTIMEKGIIIPAVRLIAPEKPLQQNITTAELDELLQLTATRGAIDHGIGSMLREIIELSQLRVNDIMVPRVDIISCDVNQDRETFTEIFQDSKLRRIPVYTGSVDNIIGMINAKELLLDTTTKIKELVKPILFVPEAGNLEKLLTGLRRTGSQVAIVVDEFGGTAGLVTLEDVLEEIVGELPDATGESSKIAVKKISDREYIIDGDLAIHQWADIFDDDLLSRGRLSTVGGFVTSRIDKIASVGDTTRYKNLSFTVESVHRGRIGSLKLELLSENSCQ